MAAHNFRHLSNSLSGSGRRHGPRCHGGANVVSAFIAPPSYYVEHRSCGSSEKKNRRCSSPQGTQTRNDSPRWKAADFLEHLLFTCPALAGQSHQPKLFFGEDSINFLGSQVQTLAILAFREVVKDGARAEPALIVRHAQDDSPDFSA